MAYASTLTQQHAKALGLAEVQVAVLSLHSMHNQFCDCTPAMTYELTGLIKNC
jgi:hypothetical protein